MGASRKRTSKPLQTPHERHARKPQLRGDKRYTQLQRDIELAKANSSKRPPRQGKGTGRVRSKRRPAAAAKSRTPKPKTSSSVKTKSQKKKGLGNFLTAKNIQESLKQVNNLRGLVKNGLGYLQQADQVLDTLYSTSNSLKDTGILDKLIKQRGKNLTTEDFTNILVALMNSPVGNQLFKGKDADKKQESSNTTATQTQTQQPQQPGPVQPQPGYQQPPYQQPYQQPQQPGPAQPQPGYQQPPYQQPYQQPQQPGPAPFQYPPGPPQQQSSQPPLQRQQQPSSDQQPPQSSSE